MVSFSLSIEEFTWSAVGLSSAFFANYATQRPQFSRFYIYPLFMVSGYLVGRMHKEYSERQMVARDVYLWDYVKKHPESFPELNTEKKKYKDVLETWKPIR